MDEEFIAFAWCQGIARDVHLGTRVRTGFGSVFTVLRIEEGPGAHVFVFSGPTDDGSEKHVTGQEIVEVIKD